MKINRLAEAFSKYYYRHKYNYESVSFLSLTDNHGDCLVCLPANLNYMLAAASKLPEIASVFPNRLIKVLVTSNIDHRSHEYIKHFTIDKPYSYDINSFYLPKRPFIQRLIGRGLTICIDLDFQHNFFNSSVSVMSGAPLRIGRSKGLGLPYYNLEIDIGRNDKIDAESYTKFMKVLYNFRDKGEELAPVKT